MMIMMTIMINMMRTMMVGAEGTFISTHARSVF